MIEKYEQRHLLDKTTLKQNLIQINSYLVSDNSAAEMTFYASSLAGGLGCLGGSLVVSVESDFPHEGKSLLRSQNATQSRKFNFMEMLKITQISTY